VLVHGLINSLYVHTKKIRVELREVMSSTGL